MLFICLPRYSSSSSFPRQSFRAGIRNFWSCLILVTTLLSLSIQPVYTFSSNSNSDSINTMSSSAEDNVAVADENSANLKRWSEKVCLDFLCLSFCFFLVPCFISILGISIYSLTIFLFFLIAAAIVLSFIDYEQSFISLPFLFQWTNRKIGFHLPDVNALLLKHIHHIFPSKTDDDDAKTCSNTRVFVPLCGKTVDMTYLTTMSSEVVGVEGIRQALEEYAKESYDDLQIDVDKTTIKNGFEYFSGKKITLLRGDYFELDESKTNGKFGIIYDRASMVAIEPSKRSEYVDVLGKLLLKKGDDNDESTGGGRILLISLERKSSKLSDDELKVVGPPFTLPESTVRELYESLDWVESVTLLDSIDQLEVKPEDRLRYPDLDQLLQHVFLIQAK